MARTRTKTELIASADEQWDKLWQLIGGMEPDAGAASFDFGDYAGTTTLGAYFVSATASHYGRAMKKLKAHLRSFK